jgi:1,4-dihydroxy-2-naphthoate octaprenyltransferase
MDAFDFLAKVKVIVGANSMLAVSTSGRSPWTAIVACTVQGEELLLTLPESFPLNAFVKRPRVSFAVGPDAAGQEIHGSGIAQALADDVARVRVMPYRYTLIAPSTVRESGRTIERRQNSWCFQQTSGSGKQAAGYGVRFWLKAARAVSFPLSVLPVCIGTALAFSNAHVDLLLFALALIGGGAAHAATNFISDYFDFVKGLDTTNALSSHTGVLVDELIEPDSVLLAGMICFMITAIAGGALVVLTGWPIIIFGLAGMIGGFMYTGGPMAWKYAGLGEFSTGFLMGPLMVIGAFYVQTRTVGFPAVLLSVAVGLLVSAVSLGNNIRDALFDSKAGITTMPLKTGAASAVFIFRVLVLLPFLLAAVTAAIDLRFAPVLAVFVILPNSIAVAWKIGRGARDFSTLSEQAGRLVLPLQVIKLHMRFCLLMLAGCVAVRYL